MPPLPHHIAQMIQAGKIVVVGGRLYGKSLMTQTMEARAALLAEYKRLCEAQAVLDAICRMTASVIAQGAGSSVAEQGSVKPQVEGSIPSPYATAITAEQVRDERKYLDHEWSEYKHNTVCGEFFRKVLTGLKDHPGASSAVKAVIEAALE